MKVQWRARGHRRGVGDILVAWLLAGCQTLTSTAGPATNPAVPPSTASPTTVAHTVTAARTLTPPATLAPAPTPTAIPQLPLQYELEAVADLAAHAAQVTATVRVVPPGSDEVVFNFNPLQQAELLEPLAVTLGGAEVAPQIEGLYVRVPLPPEAASRQAVEVTFTYALALQPVDPWAWGWRGTLGWTARQLNLGDWYPVLARYDPESGWQTPDTSDLGEYASTVASDYAVRLTVTNAPGPVQVVGSGGPQPCGEAWCATLTGGRFVAYTLSSAMVSQTLMTTTGVTVTSVYMPEHAEAGEAALEAAVAALETYTRLYGAYPFDTFVQIEGDFYDGMEYSGASFVGYGYYEEYDGTPNNLLTLISAHEVAHQWWHTLVGNDQAREPWLDEALATYSELAFLEARHPTSTGWWWAFRVDWFAPDGSVNSTIYDYADFRGYVDSVYLRGAQMLHAMRGEVGDEAFWAFLRSYAAAERGQIAAGEDFWAAYTAAGGDSAAVRAAYLKSP